jgi:outer membrane immunogenic protein
MKRSLLAVATGLGAAALLAPAAAAQVYAGAGYTMFTADAGGEDATVGGLMGRVGFKANPMLGVEGEFAIGVQEDSFDVLGTNVDVSLESSYGVFAVGWLPVPAIGDVFARVGYADLSIEATATGIGSVSDSGSGLAYGAGVQLNFIPFTKLRLEYTRYEPEDSEVDSFGASALFQF